MQKKKVLITGVSGIVGSSVYLHLRRFPKHYELFGLGRRTESSDRVTDGRVVDLPTDHHFLCDVADSDAVEHAVQGMDTVVHMAAYPKDGDWDKLRHSNIGGDYTVFESCRRAGVSRIVAASSVQVSFGQRSDPPYAAVREGRLEELSAQVPRISVAMPAEPRNVYSCTKVFTESLARTYAGSNGVSYLAIRVGWVTCDDRPPHRRAVDLWCSQRDIAGIVQACVDAPPELRFGVFYGVSNSRYGRFDMENAQRLLGFAPQDWAEDHLDGVPD